MRVWQIPAVDLLEGGLGTLPLAPVAEADPDGLPKIIHRMDERLRREAPPAEAASLWTTTFLLLELRYPRGFAEELLKGITAMRESTTYQAILEEGKSEGRQEGRQEGREEGREEGQLVEARALLLRLGRKRFGQPSEQIVSQIEAIADLGRLESLTERLLDVSDWEELLSGQ